MSITIQQGNTYRFHSENDLKIHDTLPVGNYNVEVNDMTGEFFLKAVDAFTVPTKLYGSTVKNAERIVNTFQDRPNSTGVLMSGVKGSGKTLLAKTVSIEAAKYGISTIIVNHAFKQKGFNTFIQSISFPAIILIDEFEKIYGYQEQNQLLTLLDGVYPTKKLFLLTTNSNAHINEFLKNRPGRVFYTFNFDVLDEKFVKEYLQDRLNNHDHIDHIIKYTKIYSFFNFDMLASVVEEMNRYNQTLPEVLSVLNIEPENIASQSYTIQLLVNSKEYELTRNYHNFQPNEFEYYVEIMDNDQAPLPIREDEIVHEMLINAMKIAMKSKSKASEEIKNCIDYDGAFVFNSEMLTDFDPDSNKFTYELPFSDPKIALVVTRNPSIKYKVSLMDYF